MARGRTALLCGPCLMDVRLRPLQSRERSLQALHGLVPAQQVGDFERAAGVDICPEMAMRIGQST